MSVTLCVDRLPQELREPCLKLGVEPGTRLPLREALALWGRWNYGDERCGTDAYDLTMAASFALLTYPVSVQSPSPEVEEVEAPDLPHRQPEMAHAAAALSWP